MPARNPIVLIEGVPAELPASDWLAGSDPINHALAPTLPPAGAVRVGARTLAGREFVAARGSRWPEEVMQGHLGRTALARWRGIGGAASLGSEGVSFPSSLGTATARVPGTANRVARTLRTGYVSTTTAGAIAGLWTSVAFVTLGNGAGVGGFTAIFRFVASDPAVVTGARAFIGMSSSGVVPTNVDPATLTNSVGIAQLAGAGTLQIVFGGATAQAPIDLGINFPGGGLSTDLYELVLVAPPGEAHVYYRVERIFTGDVATGTLLNTGPGTTLPGATTLLAPRLWRCNNTALLAVGIDVAAVTIESIA